MKLNSFRIQNFKSIVDTGWCNFSPDNITGLIGQNESGKSSILEALYCFRTGELQQDFIRNDDTLPVISCSYKSDEQEILKIFDKFILPEGFHDTLKRSNYKINITTTWDNEKELNYKDELDEDLKSLFNKEINIGLVEDFNMADSEDEKSALIEAISYIDCIKLLNKNTSKFSFFNDEGSLLPNTIDVELLKDHSSQVDGKDAVKNFLKVANIDIEKIVGDNSAKVRSYIQKKNTTVTANFQDFWTQTIGKGNKIKIEFELKHYSISQSTNAGKPYLEFWIDDGTDILHPKQRSKGVRWFLSFYLHLKANAANDIEQRPVLLIDEPGSNLHARAQEDVLKVFEDLKDKIQIIYTTHSQHLIELKKLYRLLAIQRGNEDDEKSDTRVIPAHHLGSASTNTLAPILEHIGVDFSNQEAVKKKNNVIIEEISALYYLNGFKKLLNIDSEINFLPATGVTNVPQLAYLLLGWGIEFSILLDDDSSGRSVYKALKSDLYNNNQDEISKRVYKIKDCSGIEDIFSRNDFASKILNIEAITETNSGYMKKHSISKPVAAVNFLIKTQDNEIKLTDFDELTISKIEEVMNKLIDLINLH